MTKFKLLIVLVLLFLFSCKEDRNNSEKGRQIPTSGTNLQSDSFAQNNSISSNANENFDDEFKNYKTYKLSNLIIADFNGDGNLDTAKFIKLNGKAGISIKHGSTKKEVMIGCGNKFYEMDDDFSWVDNWGLLLDKTTYNVIIDEDGDVAGQENISLENPSIFLSENEVGGGVITFKNGKYIWIHQSC